MEKDLPKGWECVTLDALSTIQSGGTPSRGNNNYWNGDIPWVKISDIKGWYVESTGEKITENGLNNSSTKLFPAGTILFTIFATIGKVGVLNIDAATNQAIAGITPVKDIEHKYLTYSLLELASELEKKGKGVAQKNINLTILKSIKIPLPPLAEQKRIVAKLDTLFVSLENTKTRLEKIPTLLKNFKQAILTQAVTGKLTEQWREGKELEDVVPKAIELIRSREILKGNEDLINSGRRKQKITSFKHFGNNSFGWLLVDVESTCLFIVDCLHNTPKFVSEGYYVVDTTCITPFKINWKKARKVDSIFFKKWIERLKPSYGDVLFSREGTIGIAVKVPKGADLCIGQRMMLYRMGSFVTPEFAEIYFNSYAFRDEYRSHIKGVAAQHLNIGSIRALNFPIPSIKEQTEIVRRVESLFAKTDAIEQQYNKLKQKIDTLPQALLAKAFRGELVEQNPLDEPASVLLEKIQALRQAEVKPKRKAVRKKKPSAPVDL